MKKLLFFSAFSLFSICSFGQERTYSKYLLEHFEKTELDMKSEDEIRYLEFVAQNAFVINEFPEEKSDNTNRYKIIELNTGEVDDFYDLNIEMLENDFQYFKIRGSNLLLVVKSKAIVKREFEAKK